MNITDKNDEVRLSVLADILRDFPGITAEAQRRRLTEALASLGSVTTYEAMRHLDCYDPRPRIHELRHKYGWDIVTVTEIAVTEAGERHRIGRYVLTDLPPAAPSQEAA